MGAGMIVQMDIILRTLCVLFKRRQNVYHTETINTYSYNRDVPMPLNGVGVPERLHCIALRAMCYAMPSPQLQRGRRYEAASSCGPPRRPPQIRQAPYECKSESQPRSEVLILSDSHPNDTSLSLSARLVIRAVSSTEENAVVY